jgi:hypothetical protein
VNRPQQHERAAWFYEAVAISKAMLTETPGVGQRYIAAYKDSDGKPSRRGTCFDEMTCGEKEEALPL